MFPLIAISLFVGCGCGEDRTVEDVKNVYLEMVDSFKTEEGNKFFNDELNKFAITISYPSNLTEAINNTSFANDTQKRYRALFYQQQILNNIFAYYNSNESAFYTYASGKEIDQDDLNALYDSVISLKEALTSFEQHYEAFIDATEQGLSDIMKFNITTYSYHLNNLIDSSFNFIYKFQGLYEQYGCESSYNDPTVSNLKTYMDKGYLDMSYIVYLENIKSFNQSVGENGVCDLAGIVGNENEFNLISWLDNREEISSTILDNYGLDTEAGITATNAVNTFVYCRDVFEQRLGTYLTSYGSVDNLNINQYQFNLNGGIDYNSYLKSLSSSEKATIILIDSFVSETFNNYMIKLKALI